MKTLTITISIDEPTAEFLHTAANLTGVGSVEKAVEAMIIATRSRMRERNFVEKSVDEMLDPVLSRLRSELHQRLVRPEAPPPPVGHTLTPAERRVLAALLDRAHDEFSNHICTDFNFARYVPNLEERRAIVREYEEHNSGGKGYDPEETYENYDDWILMLHFAHKLGRP